MEDQGVHRAEIQAEQPQVVKEPSEAGAHPAQPTALAQVAAAAQQPMVQQISMTSYQVPPPEKFNFKPEEWSRWIMHFERFWKATGLDQKDGESQVNTLIYSMVQEADDIVMLFGLTAEEAKQYNVVKGKFEVHFVVKGNVIFERAKFNLRSQQDGESVDNFITDLYYLAEYCESGTRRDDLIRDSIVVGIKNKTLSEQLQLNSKLTLEKAIIKTRQSETVKKQQKFLQKTKSDPPSAHVDRLTKRKRKDSKEDTKKKKKPPKSKNGKTTEARCSRCLDQRHPPKGVDEVNIPGRLEEEEEFFPGELTETNYMLSREVQQILKSYKQLQTYRHLGTYKNLGW